MNHTNYIGLLKDICAIAGVDDAAPLIESGRLAICGHTVSLRYEAGTDPQHVRVEVDLGDLREAEREAVYRSALEANFHVATPWDGAVALDPDSGRLHYVVFFPLDGSRSGADLLRMVMELVDERESEAGRAAAA